MFVYRESLVETFARLQPLPLVSVKVRLTLRPTKDWHRNQSINQSINKSIAGNKAHKHANTETNRKTDTLTEIEK